jgi:ubiquinone/menaquinone biosynthesis C-methylase UbiE
MSKAKERLDPWDKDVDKIQSFLHIQRYTYALKEVNGIILDVGCGLGYGSKMLYTTHNSVVAIDISDIALSYAKRNYPGPDYIRADAQNLSFRDAAFDCVVALEIIEHVNNGAKVLKEIYRILKRGGRLILSTPNIAHLQNRLRYTLSKKSLVTEMRKPKNPYHKQEYTSEQLVKLLETTGFKIERRWGQILPFPFANKLPPRLYVNTGRFLPDFSLHIVYKATKP